MYPVLYVGLGGFVGAVSRFLLSTWLQNGSKFPFGTMGVNILGAFVLSFLTYSLQNTFQFHPESRLFLTVGVLGAFTTMSAFSFETVQLIQQKEHVMFIMNVLGTNILCILSIYAGRIAAGILGA